MRHVQAKIWQPAPCSSYAAEMLRDELSLLPATARVLAARGFEDPESTRRFLHPSLEDLTDPCALPDMPQAVQALMEAVSGTENIVVYGDYDVDGLTSTALLVSVLRRLGGRAYPFLPDRVDEGYGLSCDALDRCIAELHPALIVTVDCGTNSIEAVQCARQAGVRVVVTDHHEPAGQCAPAAAIVNPKCGNNPKVHMLAGVGVTWNLCRALIMAAREKQWPLAADIAPGEYLDLVALGTLCDIVPLKDDNRILAHAGLERIRNTECRGLQALMEVARIRENISAYHLGFQLGPRLNAAGRMGDAMYALELLLTDDDDRARSLARHLDQANRRRQKVESDILQAALDQIEFDEERDYGLVVADTEWHAGVIGIVASRLCTRFRRPVVVIALNEDGSGRGSCRSLDAFDMVRGLDACSSVLTRWGGHHMAAGLELAPGRLREFRELFNETARQALLDADLRPVQRIDTWVDMEHINDRLWNEMQQMAPFGAEHPSPVLALARVEVMGKPRVVGNGHLRMTVRNERGRLSGIGFGMGDRELPADGMLDIAFRLHRNYFRGVSSLQMQIQDFRPSDAAFRA